MSLPKKQSNATIKSRGHNNQFLGPSINTPIAIYATDPVANLMAPGVWVKGIQIQKPRHWKRG